MSMPDNWQLDKIQRWENVAYQVNHDLQSNQNWPVLTNTANQQFLHWPNTRLKKESHITQATNRSQRI